MRLTVLARCDKTGLGIQSRNWVRLLKPDKVIVIDFARYNPVEQHREWYRDYNRWYIEGIPQPNDYHHILHNTDVLLTFEIPYNYGLIEAAHARGIKVILQNNWEFTDYLKHPQLPLPDLMVNQSYWHLEDQKELWPDITDYCPTPIFVEDYSDNMSINFKRRGTRRFLHVAGRATYEDRNGTHDLLEAVKLIPKTVPFELVIKTQTTKIEEIDDPRVTIDTNGPDNEKYLYTDFDAMIMPRRYAGACLPMNEALASGLPVIMTKIEPNTNILPNEWLVPARKDGSFMARTEIDVYSAYPKELAEKIKEFALMHTSFIEGYKTQARLIAKREFASDVVYQKWGGLLRKIGVE